MQAITLDKERLGLGGTIDELEEEAFRRIAHCPVTTRYFKSSKQLYRDTDEYWSNVFHATNKGRMFLGVRRENGTPADLIFLETKVSKFAVKAEKVVIVNQEEFEKKRKQYPTNDCFVNEGEERCFIIPIDEEVKPKTHQDNGKETISICYPKGTLLHFHQFPERREMITMKAKDLPTDERKRLYDSWDDQNKQKGMDMLMDMGVIPDTRSQQQNQNEANGIKMLRQIGLI